jgi:two-component system, chemotaxis family, CheB/CheR fusion protein
VPDLGLSPLLLQFLLYSCLITPNTTLTISNDVLHSRIRDPAERPHRPTDILFHSLAEKKRPNVIGVILSGSGSDGAKGIQAIKEAGGVTFAEQENCACFFGMPSSALALAVARRFARFLEGN